MEETIKTHLYNDCSKGDIKELIQTKYPEASSEEFEHAFANAFTSL